MNKVTVVGSGYVGLSIALLLSKMNEVTVLDISEERVNLLNSKKPTVKDELAEEFLATHENLRLKATTDSGKALYDANWVIIATPTDYDPETNYFDTSSVESVIKQAININPKVNIVVKSIFTPGVALTE